MKKFFALIIILFILGTPSVYAQLAGLNDGVIDSFDLKEFGIRFTINMAAILLLVRAIYFVRHKNKDFLFTYILFNCVNFLICFLLSGANLGVGFAFGLFAIFSIMRYRTVTLPVKEMGYMFLCVALGLLNALAPVEENYVVLLAANVFILVLALLLDRSTSITYAHDDTKQLEKNTKKIDKIQEKLNNSLAQIEYLSQYIANDALQLSQPQKASEASTQFIIYERIDLIKPEMRSEMIEDIRNRTGLPVYRVDILKIDLLHDTADIKVFFHDKEVFVNANSASELHSLF